MSRRSLYTNGQRPSRNGRGGVLMDFPVAWQKPRSRARLPRSMCGCSHIDSSRQGRKKHSPKPRPHPVNAGRWLGRRPVNQPTFLSEVCWATQQIRGYCLPPHFPPYCRTLAAYVPFPHFLDGRQDLLDVILRPAPSLGAARSSRHLDAVMIHLQLHLKTSRPSPDPRCLPSLARLPHIFFFSPPSPLFGLGLFLFVYFIYGTRLFIQTGWPDRMFPFTRVVRFERLLEHFSVFDLTFNDAHL